MMGAFNRRGKKLMNGPTNWAPQKRNSQGRGGLASGFPFIIAAQAAQYVYDGYITKYRDSRLKDIQTEQQRLYQEQQYLNQL